MFVNLSKIHLYATCISKETVHIPKTCVIQVMHIHMCMYMYTLNVLAWTYLQHWHWLCLSCKCSKMVARLKIINKLDTNNLCIRTWHTNCSCKSDVHALKKSSLRMLFWNEIHAFSGVHRASHQPCILACKFAGRHESKPRIWCDTWRRREQGDNPRALGRIFRGAENIYSYAGNHGRVYVPPLVLGIGCVCVCAHACTHVCV